MEPDTTYNYQINTFIYLLEKEIKVSKYLQISEDIFLLTLHNNILSYPYHVFNRMVRIFMNRPANPIHLSWVYYHCYAWRALGKIPPSFAMLDPQNITQKEFTAKGSSYDRALSLRKSLSGRFYISTELLKRSALVIAAQLMESFEWDSMNSDILLSQFCRERALLHECYN